MKKSAGIILYRHRKNIPEFMIVHPGGPLWKNRDEGGWSIPKGEFGDDEDPLDAAIREFIEETGFVPSGNFISLKPVVQKGGKMVFPFALEMDFDPENLVSNTFTMEWPPKTGKQQEFPEIDKGEWFTAEIAKQKLNPAQAQIIDELLEIIKSKNIGK